MRVKVIEHNKEYNVETIFGDVRIGTMFMFDNDLFEKLDPKNGIRVIDGGKYFFTLNYKCSIAKEVR